VFPVPWTTSEAGPKESRTRIEMLVFLFLVVMIKLKIIPSTLKTSLFFLLG
jgi:uncharacterized membrane protein